ncbi:MAG: peptide deformylase [Bdellovibrionaceae bacterium]|nr:peptide deformylase [Pseudobdellovibrionaceae bacterium]
MILEILTYPDPRLRKKGVVVETVTPELAKLAQDMLETMYDSEGIGLAAPQVGHSVRLLVIDTRPRDEQGNVDTSGMTELEQQIPQPLIVFNPKIVKSSGRTTYEEGCLSVPTFFEDVDRFDYIEVEAMNEKGEKILLKTDGLLAICIQHEMDHLDGKLFIDRLSPVKSGRIKKRIEKQGYPTPEEAREERARRKTDRTKQEEPAG